VGTEGAQKPLVPYVRQSRAKEKSISIEEQLRSIRGWAGRTGAVLAEPVIERGVSGSRSWRARELGRAVEACERGESGGIVVAFQDRLSRENGLGTAEVWEALDSAGARLVASSEGLDTAAGDQEMLFTIKAAIAREQWKRFRRNWSDARKNAVERGVHPVAHVPIGYARDPETGRLVPDPETADAVRSLFRLRGQGASWRELILHLEGLGIKPRRARAWSINGVRQIVVNRAYLGEAWSGEFVNRAAHEPLVTRAVWNAGQLHHPGRTARGTGGARLAGLVRCASCGGRLSPSLPGVDKRDGSTVPGRYRCVPMNSGRNGRCTAPASARMDHLDALVVDAFIAKYRDLVGPFDDEPEPPETSELADALTKAESARDALLEDPLSLAALPSDKRAELLSRAQAAVDQAQAALDSVEIAHETSLFNVWGLGDYFEPDGFKEASVPEQRRLLTLGIEQVVVARGKPRDLTQRVSITWTIAAQPS
jgi:site-specific DNA recombinase